MVYNLALLLPCAVCLVGAAWMICKREGNIRSQNILIVGFLISALFFLSTVSYLAGFVESTTFMWWDVIDSFVTMLAIPTMYLYFRSMIREGGGTWREYIWFAPALFVGITTAGLYLLMDETKIDGYIQTVLIEKRQDDNYSDLIYKLHRFVGVEIYHFVALFQILGTSIFAVLGVRKYHQRLREFYSDTDDKSIYTDTKIVHWFLLTIPLALALIVPDIKFWESRPILSSLLFIAWAVVYFALFYYGSQTRHTIDNFAKDLLKADIEERDYCHEEAEEESKGPQGGADVMHYRQISPEVYQRLVTQFAKLIDQERVYLKSDLRLDEVARLMSTNRAYVSKVIKEQHKYSFSDYINRKRIDFSMELMRAEPNITQDIIAEKSGFINAQSYSRTFKKMVGIPPKEWSYRNTSTQ